MEQKDEYDEHFKIILIGDNFVGKSCLLQSYLNRTYCSDYFDTMGVDQGINFLKIYNKKIKLRIWDASGAPKLEKLVGSYFHLADGAFICFDLTQPSTFHNTKALVKRFRASNPQAPLVLIGCKTDLTPLRLVSYKDAHELASQLDIPYLEVSALHEIKVKESFNLLTQQIYFFAHVKKIGPILEKEFDNYAKLHGQKNHSGLFSTYKQSFHQELPLREEYYQSLTQLLKATAPAALNEFCIKILDLIERVENLYAHENPYWKIISPSPLAKILRHSLRVLCSLPEELIELSDIRELIRKDRAFNA